MSPSATASPIPETTEPITGSTGKAPRPARRLGAVVASRRFRALSRPLAGFALLAVVVGKVGAAPFVQGLAGIQPPMIGVALALCAVSTAASAWRWRVVAGRLGLRIGYRRAVGMYYRSQLLNSVLPGGVLGDVHRAVAHGGDGGDLAQASRAIVVERMTGQLVQLVVTVVVLAVAGAEFVGSVLVVLAVALCLVVVVLAIVAASARLRRFAAREATELAVGLGSPSAVVQVVMASVVAIGCHVALFVVAVASVGVRVSLADSTTLALVVLLGASIPLNVGGWGPREGVAGWAFATAGLGATAGVAASTTFGVLSLIALAPGAVVIVVAATRRQRAQRPSAQGPRRRTARYRGAHG